MSLRTEDSTEKVVKNIFVDLDETLFHTFVYNYELSCLKDPADTPKEVKFEGDSYIYRPILRPGAIFLVHELRKLGEVFVCTRATHDYAVKITEMFGFGFPVNRIYSRQHVRNNRYTELHLPKGKNYLIDDLTEYENIEKTDLIGQLGAVKYIQVPCFLGERKDGFTEEEIKNIVNTIKND
jgi:hypothetical protein